MAHSRLVRGRIASLGRRELLQESCLNSGRTALPRWITPNEFASLGWLKFAKLKCSDWIQTKIRMEFQLLRPVYLAPNLQSAVQSMQIFTACCSLLVSFPFLKRFQFATRETANYSHNGIRWTDRHQIIWLHMKYLKHTNASNLQLFRGCDKHPQANRFEWFRILLNDFNESIFENLDEMVERIPLGAVCSCIWIHLERTPTVSGSIV